jgi:hypothetical protein
VVHLTKLVEAYIVVIGVVYSESSYLETEGRVTFTGEGFGFGKWKELAQDRAR